MTDGCPIYSRKLTLIDGPLASLVRIVAKVVTVLPFNITIYSECKEQAKEMLNYGLKCSLIASMISLGTALRYDSAR